MITTLRIKKENKKTLEPYSRENIIFDIEYFDYFKKISFNFVNESFICLGSSNFSPLSLENDIDTIRGNRRSNSFLELIIKLNKEKKKK